MNKKIKILAPDLPESINSAILLKWHKKIGDVVREDELIVEIETDKIVLEVSSPVSGILYTQNISVGQDLQSKSILGYIKPVKKKSNMFSIEHSSRKKNNERDFFTPKIRRLITNNEINKVTIKGIKINKKITKDNFIFKKSCMLNKKKKNEKKNIYILPEKIVNDNTQSKTRSVNQVAMNPLRKKISERLLSTIQNTAMLTTFNEVNMKPIMLLRNKYDKCFQEKYNMKLGYMSFYVKAVIHALKKFPDMNASIEDTNIVYHDYYDINIAVSTPRGLITPILKNANHLSMFEIEKKIKSFSILGQSGKLQLKDLESGTFTITNGGVFGSLFSTPIINPPQVAILGMHHIKNRPVVIRDKISILPMMYLAISYDHQLIDGKQAIQFLNCIKDAIEDFSRIIIDI
ncbi:Dihydrolipoyllysine-residue succinyltransferase component of 2-oxoglutarate dehydrogenase complex [Buchnera aphidicola (Cinara pseudotaxifoliae)]|uniref:Dihydrolipoyllysine-residue succinyltransferase n=1 Tax=Buchnera aphidicola (Cinara pseudotaxifoliae) TaxID=655384 RepID=A0A451DH01_9GAMM|nr:dihydrolipoyllysine-residue succinyltransferase [Buchnera aphidicola]VFP85906.1 Dihydrolipoyllysine-residue succinyltransferase component of 2-oxoglutarate dehydrogenase complex [Buchnera aphidicola (Cinara pseudotaxifoliae)]